MSSAKCSSLGEPSVRYRSSQRSAPSRTWRSALGAEMDELQEILERQVRKLAGSVLG